MTIERFAPFAPLDAHAGNLGDHVDLLDSALLSRDPREIVGALAKIAKSRGMSGVSRQSGIARSKLYRILGENGDPSVSEVLDLLAVMGLQLRAEPAIRNEAQASPMS